MLLAFRQGQVPLVWKYRTFDAITQLTVKFAAQPMQGQEALNSFDSPTMYGAKGGLEPHRRDWVSWKQVMLHFVL